MGCLGVHFALDKPTVQRLKAFADEDERLDWLKEELEEDYFASQREWLAETDKAWDAIHRALTDGELCWDNGTYPANCTILGGELLYSGDDYIVSLKAPDTVRDISAALKNVAEAKLREAYFRIDPDSYGFPVSEQDFEYTWHWFKPLREFYQRAAAAGRYVLFTADQ